MKVNRGWYGLMLHYALVSVSVANLYGYINVNILEFNFFPKFYCQVFS
jgi:hypothetical protein